MKYNVYLTNFILISILINVTLLGCSSQLSNSGNLLSTSTSSIPTKSPYDNRSQTAFHEFPPAQLQAIKAWNSKAKLYEIPPLRAMEKNLGYPRSLPGWFFMFKVENSPLEYYVEIRDTHLIGFTEAEPILIQKLSYTLLPININNKLLDSDKALKIYLENGGEEYLTKHTNAEIDYRLVFVSGTPNPIWSIYDASDLTKPPIFNLDAVTGKKVNDPIPNVY